MAENISMESIDALINEFENLIRNNVALEIGDAEDMDGLRFQWCNQIMLGETTYDLIKTGKKDLKEGYKILKDVVETMYIIADNYENALAL